MPTMAKIKALLSGPPPLTLAVAESMTCGRVQAGIGSISGASDFFLGGITAYTLDQKVRHLRVKRKAAAKVDCVSADVAEEMARGVCRLFGSDVGVATTGYAEPSAKARVPYAWWALARRGPGGRYEIRRGRVNCPGLKRTAAQERVAREVLAALAAWLSE